MADLGRHVSYLLARYAPAGAAETTDDARIRELLEAEADPWSRAIPLHVTASALIVHPPSRRVLLRWHSRQRAWLQVGGHADPGESEPLGIALREAREETGLIDLAPWPEFGPTHLTIVPVPARGDEPAHEHADLRFVLATARPDDVVPEHADAALRWLTVEEACELTAEANLRETLRRAGRLLAASAVSR